MINSNTIEEIKKLNKEVKQLIKENKITTDKKFDDDTLAHNIKQEIIQKALLEGLHLEDCHLYPNNPDKKHKGKNYYCIYQHKLFSILIEINYIIISYFKKPAHITLFHISMLNYGSEEQRRYKEIKKIIEPYP